MQRGEPPRTGPGARSRRRLRTGAGLLVLLASALPSWAAESAGHFGESTAVLAVELPVRVLDDGKPVTGLGAADFVIFDRGQRRDLTGFEVIDLSSPGDAATAGLDAVAAAAPRTFVLLFDLAYADGLSLAKALAASRQMVAERRAEDRVALAFFSALRGLKVLVEPTADAARLELGLELLASLLGRDPAGAARLTAALASDAAAGELAASAAEVVAEAGVLVRVDLYWPHRSVIRSFARGLAALGRCWPELAGQRMVFLLSSGFDPLYLTGRGAAGTLNELERALHSLRQAGWVIQAINIGGLRVASGRESLFYLAVETGGESFENFNDVQAAMRRALLRSSVTYLLVFQADGVVADGSFHRLKVRLAHGPAGARVRHRPGYYAPEPPLEVP